VTATVLALFLLSSCEDDCQVEGEGEGGIVVTIPEGLFVGGICTWDGDGSFDFPGVERPIRLLGVNTPETHVSNPTDCKGAEWDDMVPADQLKSPTCCYGVQAKESVCALWTAGTKVTLTDGFGGTDFKADSAGGQRDLADVWVGQTYLNAFVAAGGLATVYPAGSIYAHPNPDTLAYLLSLQAAAKQNGIGLWGYCPQ
jgi:endonuclease YncB( thermonuclease family)